ncbi:MAG: CoA-binding protein, partial [Methyloceanibacter sp.]
MNHDTYSDAYIRGSLSTCRIFAVGGASPTPSRPSYFVMKYLMAKGFHILPVNPAYAGSEIVGQKAYASLAEIGTPVDVVDIFRNSEAALQ